MTRETRVQSQVALYQKLKIWYLIPPCLTLSIIRYVSRVKLSNPMEGVAPSPTPRCHSFCKGCLQLALDYGRKFYFYIYETNHSHFEQIKFLKLMDMLNQLYTHTHTYIYIYIYHIYLIQPSHRLFFFIFMLSICNIAIHENAKRT